jgi:hypothetical protein
VLRISGNPLRLFLPDAGMEFSCMPCEQNACRKALHAERKMPDKLEFMNNQAELKMAVIPNFD